MKILNKKIKKNKVNTYIFLENYQKIKNIKNIKKILKKI